MNTSSNVNPSRHISIDSAALPIQSHASLQNGLHASQVGLFSRVLNENFNREAAKSVVSLDVKDDPSDRLEFRLKMKDLEELKNAFDSYKTSDDDESVKLNKSEFVQFMNAHLNKGTQKEYEELFDNIDVSQSGRVDFDEFTSYLLIMLYETDDRHTKLSIPNWKPIKQIYNVHRDTIQRIDHLKSLNRYLTISKEGCCCLYDKNLHMVNNTKLNTESCKSKDLWVTDFIILQNVNKLAIAFTTKEIEIHELNTKLEFNPIYKIYNLKAIPLCLDYWYDPANPNDSILCWGDTAGCVHTIHFNSSLIALFERSSNTNQSSKSQSSSSETANICLDINVDEIKLIYKNAMYIHFKAHTAWVRQVKWIKNLDCVMSCASTSKQSICMGWFQRKSAHIRVNYSVPIRVHEKTTHLNIVNGGVNAFDFDSKLNLLATANQNTLVNLFNPYVLEPTGVLKGHSRAVLSARFLPSRSQLISFSADKILRVWNVQLQICIQKVSNSFPKGPDVDISCFFDDTHSRFFIAFRFSLFMMEIKPEVTDRVTTHSGSVMAVKFNKNSNQVVTLSQDGTVFIWLIESGQKIKTFTNLHGNAELLTLDFDESYTRFYTGSADGTIKIWDFNGHCHHTLVVNEGQNCEITQMLNLKRRIIALGWKRDITVFRDNTMKDERVEPSEWNAKQTVHDEDILCAAVMSVPPMLLATGGFDGLIVIWNSVSELPSKFLTARRKLMVQKDKSNNGSTAPSSPTKSRLHSRQVSRQQSEKTFLTQHSDQNAQGNKAHSAATTTESESDDYGCSITCMRFLNSRIYGKDCMLVSCGGNGWVRFWEVASGNLGGEFVAHARVNSIIMEIDESDKYLATGDLNGLVKIWDISEFCISQSDSVAGAEPPLFSTIQSHNDSINSICFYKKSDKQLYVLLGSSDCSVSLNDINGTLLGIFGQETHWRMDSNPSSSSLMIPSIIVSQEHIGGFDAEEKNETVEHVVVTSLDSGGDHLVEKSILVDTTEQFVDEDKLILPKLNKNFKIESTFEYEKDAFVNDTQLRYNPWSKTILGKTYQDERVKKRDRRQPSHTKSEEFERWEKTGQVRGGLYGSLHIVDMDEDAKSDKIMAKILSDRKTLNQDKNQKLKNPAADLKSAFDEKTLFPKYILDYEARMRQEHKIILAKLGNTSTTTATTNQLNKSQTSNNESSSFLISRKKRNSTVSTS